MKVLSIIREGFYFAGVALLIALFLGVLVHPYAAILPAVLACYCIYFFRNPDRKIPADENLIVSPADGTVQDVVEVDADDFIKSPCRKVIIFLSVFDVHVNRSPIAGEIKIQKYICGRFRPAYKDSVGFENERHLIGIENERLRVTVTQVAGILARRIVSWVTLDDKLEKGELYGLIRFGSCTELVMPANVEVLVKKGDKVRGGESIIGKIRDKG
ncbi:MAG: phosphatidylserine decarboxylase family protein [Selenomonadaceae bacterium]|nr:phosphatidylserine decarboxylase family protein [Selenomonadaceae bacterium]